MTAAEAPRRSFYRDWICTVDHKKIGIMYAVVSLFMLIFGGAAAVMIRTKLAIPGENALVSPDMFNQLFTMHGTIMIFGWVIPMLTGAFANYLVPIMIGAHDMAFPRMNALSFWLFLTGGLVLLSSIAFGNAPDVGWTAYPPYSIQSAGAGLDFWVTSVHILGMSSILGAINIIVTIFNMRAPGMTFNRMPLFVWSMLATSLVQVFGTPALAGAVTTLLFDRHLGTTFYDVAAGGDPMLYQHLFWFYSHPAVYIMIIPAMGIVSEIIPVFARKPIFGYHAIAYSSMAIGILGFFVWAHHMFVAGMQISAGIPFMITSMIIAVPTAIKIFSWLATMWRGAGDYKTPMLFVTLGFIGNFTVGGLSGIILAAVPIDLNLHDTYFVVAHFHYVLFGGSMMAIMAGVFYWFPKVTGRNYNETLGQWTFWLYFIGTNLTFFPMHFLGLMGMPRRVYDYNPNLQFWNDVATAGSYVLSIATIMVFYNIAVSLFKGTKAADNPWGAQTLEWTVSSPPPEHNFLKMPVVTAPPYEYGAPAGSPKLDPTVSS